MGIRGLNKLISLYSVNSIFQKHISGLKGAKVAIDSEILIYQFRSNGEKNSHIYGFINNISWYLRNGIIPVYVFDGAPNIAKKKNVLVKRLFQKERIYQKAEELEIKFFEKVNAEIKNKKSMVLIFNEDLNKDFNELLKIQKKISTINVNRNHRHECRYLLKLLGIPYINAKEDAEELCVSLYHNGLVDFIYTEDTDALVYSAAKMISRETQKQNINSPMNINSLPMNISSLPMNRSLKILKKNSNYNYVTIIDVEKVIKNMNLTLNQFIDLCILCGCDFCSTIPKIGPIKSYNLIRKYQSIENIRDSKILDFPEDFKYQEAREIFFAEDSPVEKDLGLSEPDLEGLSKYLINEREIKDVNVIIEDHINVRKFFTNNYKNTVYVDQNTSDLVLNTGLETDLLDDLFESQNDA
jgi:flap endonuclease-1